MTPFDHDERCQGAQTKHQRAPYRLVAPADELRFDQCVNDAAQTHGERLFKHDDPLRMLQGRAHGIEALVVADASIMPTVPRANTNLTTIMIGEKVGEWLRTRPEIYGL